MEMELSQFYTAEVIATIRAKLTVIDSSKQNNKLAKVRQIWPKATREAALDILINIENCTITTDDELEDYIECHYYEDQNLYYSMNLFVGLLDGDTTIDKMFTP